MRPTKTSVLTSSQQNIIVFIVVIDNTSTSINMINCKKKNLHL